MLDIKLIRAQADAVKQGVKDKNEKVDIDKILELDEKKRAMLTEVEELKHVRKEESKKVGEYKRQGRDASEILEKLSEVSDKVKDLDSQINEIEKELQQLLLWVPNLPDSDVPKGDESQNRLVRSWGEVPSPEFSPKTHWDLGKEKGILELERAAKLSGSGFVATRGDGARLERALLSFMLDVHTQEHGYTEVSPPHLVTRATITNSGQLPKLEEDMYLATTDDLFLIPTSEVPLTNLYQDEILDAQELPIYLTAATSCFRREAGAAGKDTRGLLRVHEFKKVEMIKITTAQESENELEKMVANAEVILQRLKIPYRILMLASGDMSFASRKTYDLEIWAQGVGKWLEVSSCSNCGDFQARRANLRYRKKGEKPVMAHLLNGSGVAVPRLLVAILENYQQADGKIAIPEVLRPYMNGQREI